MAFDTMVRSSTCNLKSQSTKPSRIPRGEAVLRRTYERTNRSICRTRDRRYGSLEFPFDSGLIAYSAWASAGGIVGRGVLLDYAAFAERNKISLKPFETRAIPLAALLQIATEQGTIFREGDILFVRTGFTAAYEALSALEKSTQASRPIAEFAGVESSTDMLRWLWTSGFAAVAADCPAFESSPVGRTEICTPQTALHPVLLGGWGMPIGELFDLEPLAEHCQNSGRWTFFLSSVPLKVCLLDSALVGPE